MAELSDPATHAFAITPDNSTAITFATRAIYVGTGGDITLRGANSPADVLLKAVPTGSVLPIRTKYVRATGTTAADLVGLT